MSKRTWIIIIILLVGAFGFLWYSGKSDKKEAEQTNQTATTEPKKVVDDDHITGSKDKKIVVMEYLDFECSACASLYPIVKETMKKYGDKVTFVHRHFPLTGTHPNALAASRAAEAAGKQGKFFEMEDLLFTNHSSWESRVANTAKAQKTFEEYAQQLGLNMDQFKKDFASGDTLARINRDRASGGKLDVQSTPTFFLNGEKLNLQNRNDLGTAIDDAISQNKIDPTNAKP